jgi:hypothetical protein
MPLSDFHDSMKGWVPAPVVEVPKPQIPDPTTQVSPYLRCPLPLPMQYSPDTLRQSNRPGLSSFRIAPLPPGGNPAINAASGSVTQAVIAALPPIPVYTSAVDGGTWNVTTKTAPYTAAAGDMVLVDTTGGGVTITLPTAASNSKKSIRVKKISSDVNTVTVARSSADSIDGSTSQTFTSQYTDLEVTSDSVSNWEIA